MKLENRGQTGSGGGPESKFHECDRLVQNIVEQDSPIIVRLGVAYSLQEPTPQFVHVLDSGDYSVQFIDLRTITTATSASAESQTPKRKFSNDHRDTPKTKKVMVKYEKLKVCEVLRAEKLKLQVEHLQMSKYLLQLDLLEKERKLDELLTVSVEQLRNERAEKREIPEKTRLPAASLGTIPTCKDPGATPSGIEPGSTMWEARGAGWPHSRSVNLSGTRGPAPSQTETASAANCGLAAALIAAKNSPRVTAPRRRSGGRRRRRRAGEKRRRRTSRPGLCQGLRELAADAAPKREVSRTRRARAGYKPLASYIQSSAGLQERRKMEDPRENPPTSGIVRYDSHVPKSGGDPTRNRTLFALVGGEWSNHHRAPLPSLRNSLVISSVYLCTLRY
ncbi:hypothetical protein PR048_015761 [Dryococelus australis]|uniref:Uncharacterized protein n=1 Tax=Dryococelus australis TaxID=614101 RepID=A0ABQ9HHU6_9NEOP|nr:hypothetical protein PR048_015761 [Dryococelus australis]